MRLTYDFDDNWQVEGPDGKTITLAQFCHDARVKAQVTRSQLNGIAGLAHPTVSSYENGSSRSVRAMLIALDALGYEIEIKEPSGEPNDGGR